jgi:peptide/nickel transport system permease protein
MASNAAAERISKAIFRIGFMPTLAVVTLVILACVALAAPLLTPFDPLQTGVGAAFVPPNSRHWMGTDDLGRDIFSGVIYGARISLGVALIAATASASIGIVVGLYAGFYRGWVDAALTRVTEVFFVIPMVFLAILFIALFGSSIWNVIVVISVLSWPATARLVRGQVLSLRERDFVRAARVIGERPIHIMMGEILPNARAPVIVNASIQMAQAIVVEAGLSFLGLGDPTLTSWGVLLYNAQKFLLLDAWWTFVFPGCALFMTVLAFNILADSLNNQLNARTRNI